MRKRDHDYAKARRLRRQLTLPEGLLWRELRARKTGFKFRKQHPVGKFVLDFYCAQAKHGFEIDGAAHDMGDNPEHDCQRDAWLLDQGITVIRFPASEVLADPSRVAEAMVAICEAAAD